MTLPTKFNSKNLPINYSAILEFKDISPGIIEPLPELEKVRGSLKAIWLREHRQEIIDYFNRNGRTATMQHFRIYKDITLDNLIAEQAIREEEEDKHPDIIWGHLPGEHNSSGGGGRKIPKGSPVPPGWYVFKRGIAWDYVKPASEVAGLRGGEKMLWLREHREEVEEFFYQYGEAATLNRFCLKSETLDAVLQGGRHTPFVGKFTRLDKLELTVEALSCDNRDLREENRKLREAIPQFLEGLTKQLGENLFRLLMQGGKLSDTPKDIEEILLKGG